jgi:hypothetical protein
MAAPLSFRMVKTGGFASLGFPSFAPCFMAHTLPNAVLDTKLASRMAASGTSGG